MAYDEITYADKVENNGVTPAGRFGADDLNEIKAVTNANGASFDGRIDALEAGGGGGGVGTPVSSSFVGDGATVAFVLTFTPITQLSSAFVVGIDGVLQSPVDAYTVSTNTSEITFSSAPPVGSDIVVTTSSIFSTDLSESTVVAAGSTEARKLTDRFADTVNVIDFGAVGDGVTDDTVAVQAAIDAVDDGQLFFPAGTYLLNSDIVFDNKNAASQSRLYVEATGAVFTGAGNIIIDRTKKLEFNGANLGDGVLELRAVWWSTFTNMTVSQVVFGDGTSTGFDASYWTRFENCLMQNVTIDSAATAGVNDITFSSCSFRGNAGQGFSSTFDYAFDFDANQDQQSWSAINCDISYHNIGVYKIGVAKTSTELEFAFDNCYFDTLIPEISSQDRIRINILRGHGANFESLQAPLSAALNSRVDIMRNDRGYRLDAATNNLNLIPYGDLRTKLSSWVGSSNRPVGGAPDVTVTSATGGFTGNYLNLNQSLSALKPTYFANVSFEDETTSSCILVIRNADAGSKQMRVQYNGLYSNVDLVNTEWTVVTLSDQTKQSTAALSIYDNNLTAYNIDIAYVGIFHGDAPLLFADSMPEGLIFHTESTNFPNLLSGAVDTQDFTVTGASVGDFVDVTIQNNTNTIGYELNIHGYVVSTDTVRVFRHNPTASAIDVPVVNVGIKVSKFTF